MMTQVLDEDEKFPMEIQENIVKFVKETLFPAILDHVASIYPPLFGLPITVLSFECFFITMVHLKMPSLEKSGLISSN